MNSGTTNPSTSSPPKSERTFINALPAILGTETIGGVPFGDDMAPLGKPDWLWTTDTLMDGVDFDSGRHSWHAIGQKSMAVNLSDCAAMGVRPRVVLVAVVLENRLSMPAATELMRGIADIATRYRCRVTGGDTSSWDHPTVISVTVAARPEPRHKPILRSGGQPGDRIFVSGKVGGSILGRHMTARPRVGLGLRLNRAFPPTCMIDISDGLACDLWHICEASGCGAELSETDLQSAVHSDACSLAKETGRTPLDHALHDGEDFELIVCLRGELPDGTPGHHGLIPIGRASCSWLTPPASAVRSTNAAGSTFVTDAGIAIELPDAAATLELGRRLGTQLVGGECLALCGPLGAGKTLLTKGLALGLGVAAGEPVVSPTFVLVREYQGRLRLVHADAYRLASADELRALGLDEQLSPDTVIVVEWADRFPSAIPESAIWVELEYADHARKAMIRNLPAHVGL
jgi:thiamine-monophosphate kinase